MSLHCPFLVKLSSSPLCQQSAKSYIKINAKFNTTKFNCIRAGTLTMEKRGKTRDNFSQSVLKILHRRAGGKCCRCGANTFGPVKNKPLQSVNIGKGIESALAS